MISGNERKYFRVFHYLCIDRHCAADRIRCTDVSGQLYLFGTADTDRNRSGDVLHRKRGSAGAGELRSGSGDLIGVGRGLSDDSCEAADSMDTCSYGTSGYRKRNYYISEFLRYAAVKAGVLGTGIFGIVGQYGTGISDFILSV